MQTPHDRLFKATFSQLEHARSELECVLPPALATRIDWSTLALTDGTFSDDELALLESDLLFTVQLAGRSACLYLLFEHQSTVDTDMPLRLLRYMLRVWERFRKDHASEPLPLIVPVVLHHSSRGWTGPTGFRELLGIDDELARDALAFIPDFTFVLDDLHALDDRALRQRAVTELVRLTYVVLQRCRGAEDPVAILRPWADVFVAVLTAPAGAQALHAIARYTLEITEGRAHDIGAFFAELGPPAQEAFMTAAEKLTEEVRAKALAQGRLEGRVEGRVEGEAAILLRQLGRRFGQVPTAIVEQVKGATTAELELWADRVLSANSLAEVFAGDDADV